MAICQPDSWGWLAWLWPWPSSSPLAVPAAAIATGSGDPHVFVVEDGEARLQRVETGTQIGDQIEVRGLAAGTRVVIRPPPGLSDGRAITAEAK
jgi:hypothetical protein